MGADALDVAPAAVIAKIRFVLPDDVVLQPVVALTDAAQRQIGAGPGEVAIMRTSSRELTRVLSAEAAGLIERFRREQTIVEAVIDFSRAVGAAPEHTLDKAFPLLEQLIASRMLVEAGSEHATAIQATLRNNDCFAGYRIITCIQLAEDSEVFQAVAEDGQIVALKIGRRRSAEGHSLLANEASVLAELDTLAAPRLVATGSENERRYVATEWRAGVPLLTAASELRQAGGPAAVLSLVVAVLDSYESLHKCGVLHGDVHPHNVLVDGDGAVTVIDYGVALRIAHAQRSVGTPPRLGVPFFIEPEQASAAAQSLPVPAATPPGEQYAIAAMLYLIVAGSHYLDFSLERGEMLRQIAQDPPMPLARRGALGMDDVEHSLFRALAKDPADRFADVAELKRALADAASRRRLKAGHAHVPEPPHAGTEMFDATVARLGVDGQLLAHAMPQAPICSVHNGAAGIAYALLRAASVRSDPHLLALASVWISKALAHIDDDIAFHGGEIGVMQETIGHVSPLHTRAGVHCVHALVSNALGDDGARQLASTAFIEASAAPCESLDLTLGRSGTVLACALLLETGRGDAVERDAVRALGRSAISAVWERASEFGPIGSGDGVDALGIAHGWAGLLYAALRWRAVAEIGVVKRALDQRLNELAACAEPWGRGHRWQVAVPGGNQPAQYVAGWCNGSAGYVHLWSLAHDQDPSRRWLDLARSAGWSTWEGDEPLESVCCGRAGRVYSLLNLYRTTRERDWLNRARMLGRRAPTYPVPEIVQHRGGEYGLYQGGLGVALMEAELEADPVAARMPFFEFEGWPPAADTASP
jgi:hypothetical protein